MDRFDALKAFVRVVETGSFTRAADTLGVNKSVVSSLVSQLEARLQTRLLQRTTRRVQPTAEGLAFRERAQQILADLDEAESSLRMAKQGLTGPLRVDVPAVIGRHLLVPALPTFLAAHPELALEIGCSDRSIDLLREGVDCVIRGGKIDDGSLVARPLGTLSMWTVAAPAWVERNGLPTHPIELAERKVVTYVGAASGRQQPLRFRRQTEEHVVRGHTAVLLNDTDACVAAALVGLGAVQLPAFLTAPLVTEGRLHRLLPDWKAEGVALHLGYPARRHLTARVRTFGDWVAGICATVDGSL